MKNFMTENPKKGFQNTNLCYTFLCKNCSSFTFSTGS